MPRVVPKYRDGCESPKAEEGKSDCSGEKHCNDRGVGGFHGIFRWKSHPYRID